VVVVGVVVVEEKIMDFRMSGELLRVDVGAGPGVLSWLLVLWQIS
jgi:hypothetical protein